MASLDDRTWPVFSGRRTLLVGGVLAVVGLVIALILIALEPRRALLGYLFAYAAVLATAVGALILLLIGYAANAKWLAALRRIHESLAIVFPVLAVLFIPIAIGMDYLYPWVSPAGDFPAHELHILESKRAWLNPTGFVIRSVIYLAVFLAASEVLRRWSLRRDREPIAEPHVDGELVLRRERALSCAMLPAVGIALTFAAFDWVMSLQPLWVSTMFGVYVFAGGFAAGIAWLAIIAARARVTADITDAITPHHFHALGRMLFAFVVFWAYTAYFQGFLIQIADRPAEVTFFLARMHGGWEVVLALVIATHFVIPFLLLLPRRLKLRPRYTVSVAVIIIIGHILDVYWMVVPAGRQPLGDSALGVIADLAAFIGILGACIAISAWRQRGVPVIAIHDPFVPAGIHYASPT